jgi:tRNA nucleotidyltransferase (CCA-adding enzyme)
MVSGAEIKAKGIFDTVLKDIKPTKSDIKTMTMHVNYITEKLARIAGREVEIRVAGSIAKGTYLKGDADVDIFLLFKRGTSKQILEKRAIEYGKKLVSAKSDYYVIKYAEHPYVRVYLHSIGVNADLVPATKIDNPEELATTVDRTPFHTEFILSNMTERQKDETRVLKALLKAHNIYGAEVKTSGFSGYLCELLIHHFGSLYSLLNYMSRAQDVIVLFPKDRTDGDIGYTKRFHTNFVVTDPVDKNRNVAAGVSQESLARLILISKRFMERPSIELFYRRGYDKKGTLSSFIKESSLDVHAMVVKTKPVSEDIIWPQLRKAANMICNRASQLGFRVYVHAEIVNKEEGIIVFVTPNEEIGSRIIKGPKANLGQASLKFMDAHKKAVGFLVEGDSINAIERSECKTFSELLANVSKGKQVKIKNGVSVKGARLFLNKSIPQSHASLIYKELAKKLSV